MNYATATSSNRLILTMDETKVLFTRNKMECLS